MDGLNASAVKFVGGFPGTGRNDKARKKSTSHYVKTIVKNNLGIN